MHFRFDGRPNAVPDNYDDIAIYEVHIALLLHVEVFRDDLYGYFLIHRQSLISANRKLPARVRTGIVA